MEDDDLNKLIEYLFNNKGKHEIADLNMFHNVDTLLKELCDNDIVDKLPKKGRYKEYVEYTLSFKGKRLCSELPVEFLGKAYTYFIKKEAEKSWPEKHPFAYPIIVALIAAILSLIVGILIEQCKHQLQYRSEFQQQSTKK